MLIHFLNADYNFVFIIVYESMKKNTLTKKIQYFFDFLQLLGYITLTFNNWNGEIDYSRSGLIQGVQRGL